MKMPFEEAMRLKDQMPKGLFRRVDGQAADEIWLAAIDATERYYGIPRMDSSPWQRTNDFEEWPREKLITLINGIMKLLLWITVGLWAIALTILLVSRLF